jgi:hypothetical protein
VPTDPTIIDPTGMLENLTDSSNAVTDVMAKIVAAIQDIPLELAKIPASLAAAMGGAATKPVDDATKKMNDAAISVGSFSSAILALPQQMLTANFGSIGDIFSKIGEEVRRLNADLVALPDASTGVSRMNEPFDRLTKSLMNYGALLKHTDMFDTFTATGSSAISTLDDNFKGLQAGLSNLGIKVNLPGGSFVENASQAEKLQNSYIGLTAQAGEMNKMFKSDGTTLEDL